jgi:tetratricopeptide (TPR) repeat protein
VKIQSSEVRVKTGMPKSSSVLLSLSLVAALSAPGVAFSQEKPEGEPAEVTEQGENETAEEAGEESQPSGEPEEAQPKGAPPKESDLSDEDRAAYDRHLSAGKAAYAEQDFTTAAKQLQAAHDIHPKPSILFNLGLISEKAGNLEGATDYYQQFLEAPGVTLENRQRASSRLAAVQEILETSSSAEEAQKKQEMTDLLPALEAMGIQSMPEDTTAQTETGTETETGGTETANTSTTDGGSSTDGGGGSTDVDASASASTPEVKYNWPVYASFATATVALVGGVGMVAMTNNRIEEGKEAGQAGDDAGLAAAEEDASTYATAAAGLFAGGAVLAVVGSYFVIRNSQVAVEESAPTPSQTAPSASLSFSVHKKFLGPILRVKF